MAAFEFQAIDADGKPQRGVLQGDTARAVRQSLRERGLTPLQVDAVAGAAAASTRARLGWSTGMSATARAMFTRQLATLVRAALPLDEALSALSEQSESERERKQLAAIRAKMLEGESLAASLAAYPQSFDQLYTAAVAAGESSGKLPEVLEQLADYGERQSAFAQKISAALIYPALLFTVAIAVTAGLLGYVVPRVIAVFDGMEAKLPLLTRVLLAISDLVGRFGMSAGVLLLLTLITAVIALRRPTIRAKLDGLILRLPIFGKLTAQVESARLAQTMAIATGAAVPALEALRISTRVVKNLTMRHALEQAAVRVREGTSLSRAIADSKRFPTLLSRLIASGEKSGELPRMLAHAAELTQRQVQASLSLFVALIEPAMILLMGAIVLFIVLAILLPIFQLDQLIGVAR